MVDARVIYVGIFLVEVRAFGDASDQQGVPTFLVCASERKAVAEA